MGRVAAMVTAMVLLAGAGGLQAQEAADSAAITRAGPRTALPLPEEIALARSGAPAKVSAEATIIAWNGSEFVTAVEGTGEATCYVARGWPDAVEPHCFDAEGARTILPIHLLENRLRHEGVAEEEIEARVAEGIRSGELQLPTRPVMSYMMSAAQEIRTGNGTPIGAWRPHLMIYYPYLTDRAIGSSDGPVFEAGVVLDAGTALSNITIPVAEFVEVEDEGADG